MPATDRPKHALTIGTAGHIDHGKTALVKALTGIDTDRLGQEKARGITIELGFAHFETDNARISVVDVPGHERFIRAMVAGASGIDLVVFIVAADEGVMPQTREHLEVCRALAVPGGIIVLSKVDLVDADWLALVTEDVRQAVANSFLADAPIIPCSAVTGEGIDTLKAALAAQARAVEHDDASHFRLPVDRVFSLKGFGTIVTGTVASGQVSHGDNVSVAPEMLPASVRQLQSHGAEIEQVGSGARVAVNLSGLEVRQIQRGATLCHRELTRAWPFLDVQISIHSDAPTLPRDSPLLIHHGTAQYNCRCVVLDRKELLAGETALAQLRIEQPIVALPGDRFVLRGFHKQQQYGTTIGGGRVLRVGKRRLRPRDQSAITALCELVDAAAEQRIALEVKLFERGVTIAELGSRLPYTPKHLGALLRQQNSNMLVQLDEETLIHRDAYRALIARFLELLRSYHQRHPVEPGMSREALRSQLRVDTGVFVHLLNALIKDQQIVADGELCRIKGFEPKGDAQAEQLAQTILALVRDKGLAPLRDDELIAASKSDADAVTNALTLLRSRGAIVRVASLHFCASAVADLEQSLRAYLAEHQQIAAADFKQLVGQSRKFVIPLAEYFDRQRVTLRRGDVRVLR